MSNINQKGHIIQYENEIVKCKLKKNLRGKNCGEKIIHQRLL